VKRSLEQGHRRSNRMIWPYAKCRRRSWRAAPFAPSSASASSAFASGSRSRTEQTLFWTDLENASLERRDLSSLVTPGYRAVYVRAMREDQGSALIRPGDYVDVIVTSATSRPAEIPEPPSSFCKRVLVLANGLYTSPTTMSAEKTKKPTRRCANRASP